MIAEANVDAVYIATPVREHLPQALAAAREGKPEEIVQKMVEGRLRKHLNEITLTGQPFVKNPDTRIEKLLSTAGASALGFVRYEVGEGVES